MDESYIKLNTIPELFKKYNKLLNALDKMLDQLVDLLNDLKLMDPEIELDLDKKKQYQNIINEFENGSTDTKYNEEELLLVGSQTKLRGIELPKFSIENDGIYQFSFPKNNSKYEIKSSIENCNIIFDGYIEIRKSIYVLKKLVDNILEFKNHLWLIKESME